MGLAPSSRNLGGGWQKLVGGQDRGGGAVQGYPRTLLGTAAINESTASLQLLSFLETMHCLKCR
jgi:hypothetical protein